MNLLFRLRKKFLTSRLSNLNAIRVLVKFVPSTFKYGSAYRKTISEIRAVNSGHFSVMEYQQKKFEGVAKRFNETGFGLTRGLISHDLGQLATIPPMKATDLPSSPEYLCSTALSECELCSTSGSTGVPKVFFLAKTRGPVETAFVHQAWRSAGFRHTDSRAVFRGIEHGTKLNAPFFWNAALQELQISPFKLSHDLLPLIWKEIESRKLRFIHGYPSSIEVVAKWISQNPDKTKGSAKIKGLLMISEELLPHQLELFKRAFPNSKVVSFYGQSEKVAFATQDGKDQSVFHFSPLYGITELLDEHGLSISVIGQQGNLYSTGLLFEGTSFVRYELGDKAELVSLPTKENNYVLSVRNIRSRWAALPIIGKGGVNLSLASINMHSSELLDFARVQFVQRNEGELDIVLVPHGQVNESSLTSLQNKFKDKLGDSLDLNFLISSEVLMNSRGKTKLFISHLGKDA